MASSIYDRPDFKANPYGKAVKGETPEQAKARQRMFYTTQRHMLERLAMDGNKEANMELMKMASHYGKADVLAAAMERQKLYNQQSRAGGSGYPGAPKSTPPPTPRALTPTDPGYTQSSVNAADAAADIAASRRKNILGL